MEKLALAQQFRTYYRAKSQSEIVTFTEATYLSITGEGDPATKIFSDKIGALYASAYGIKFACKASGQDFVMAKLEGLWWFDTNQYANLSAMEAPVQVPRDQWQWRLLIRVPGYVSQEMVNTVRKAVGQKKKLPLAAEVSLFTYTEGKVVQMLHTDPFSTEPESLRKMEEFIAVNNLQRAGLHHKIYLSDFTKANPARLKTVLREPIGLMQNTPKSPKGDFLT